MVYRLITAASKPRPTPIVLTTLGNDATPVLGMMDVFDYNTASMFQFQYRNLSTEHRFRQHKLSSSDRCLKKRELGGGRENIALFKTMRRGYTVCGKELLFPGREAISPH